MPEIDPAGWRAGPGWLLGGGYLEAFTETSRDFSAASRASASIACRSSFGELATVQHSLARRRVREIWNSAVTIHLTRRNVEKCSPASYGTAQQPWPTCAWLNRRRFAVPAGLSWPVSAAALSWTSGG